MKVLTYKSIGYAVSQQPDHPRAMGHGGYVYEHVLIAERAIGKSLDPKHPIHHVNGVKSDNRNQNLVVCEDKLYHQLLHRRQRIADAGGDPNTDRICSRCQRVLPKTDFHRHHRNADGLQVQCKRCEYVSVAICRGRIPCPKD